MTPSFAKTIDDTALKEAEKEVTTTLVHLKQLLCVKNRLCSPLLQLPEETIIHILSFVMGDMGFYSRWRPIYTTCRRIHRIMCNATALWWKVDLSFERNAKVVLMKSKGDPQVVIAMLERSYSAIKKERILDYWRDNWQLQSHRLHTLELYGSLSSLPHFSWIFERSLPRLEHLTFHVDWSRRRDESPTQDPVPIQLPVDMPLRVLDLGNVAPPWSSEVFTGLNELHLDFRRVTSTVECELFRILDASPQLERLSLVHVRQTISMDDNKQLHYKRIVELPALTFLKLENEPEVVGYFLAHLDTPVLASLKIGSGVRDGDITRSLGHFLPGDHLPKRLFSDPPIFKIGSPNYPKVTSLIFSMGGFEVDFHFGLGNANLVAGAFVPLVPQSVTTLKFEFSELDVREWKEFFRSHPEVRVIECTEFHGEPVSESFWDALTPPEDGDQVPLCPRLESVTLKVYTDTTKLEPPISCLRRRRDAGFKLRHFKITEIYGMADRMTEDIGPLVEMLEVETKLNKRSREVSPISVDRPGTR